jgi:hypothetical protein
MKKVTRRSLLGGILADRLLGKSKFLKLFSPAILGLTTNVVASSAPIQEKHTLLLKRGLNLGKPIGPEDKLITGGNRQIFQFGAIYFHPRVGAFELHGLILRTYLEMGEEASRLGYPITDEVDSPTISGGRMNGFEQGVLLLQPDTKVVSTHFLVPQIVVKVRDSVRFNLRQGETLGINQFANLAGPFGAPIVRAVAQMLPNLEFRRLFDVLTAQEIRSIVDRARANNPKYSGANLENFLQVICPIGFDTGPLVAAISQLSMLVEHVYAVRAAENAGVVGITNPKFIEQRYLLPAPLGIGVISAWLKGADGSGCRLVDMEHAWLLNRELDDRHEDLPVNIPLLGGFNRRDQRGHGTAVFGVIAAQDNNLGVVGIAPKTIIHAISPDDPSGNPLIPPTENIPAKLKTAGKHLGFGDVLLLEMQFVDKLPVETDKAVFEAIYALTSRGIVVIECAGNGGKNLDSEQFFGDSGAIIVGACNSAPPHARRFNSNFGTRVDCMAWGDSVVTTGDDVEPVNPQDYFEFSATSAAGAIIAGVCLLVQQLHRMKTGHALHPLLLRSILRDKNNCTPASSDADRIGHMPDLTKIISNLGL